MVQQKHLFAPLEKNRIRIVLNGKSVEVDVKGLTKAFRKELVKMVRPGFFAELEK